MERVSEEGGAHGLGGCDDVCGGGGKALNIYWGEGGEIPAQSSPKEGRIYYMKVPLRIFSVFLPKPRTRQTSVT